MIVHTWNDEEWNSREEELRASLSAAREKEAGRAREAEEDERRQEGQDGGPGGRQAESPGRGSDGGRGCAPPETRASQEE